MHRIQYSIFTHSTAFEISVRKSFQYNTITKNNKSGALKRTKTPKRTDVRPVEKANKITKTRENKTSLFVIN